MWVIAQYTLPERHPDTHRNLLVSELATPLSTSRQRRDGGTTRHLRTCQRRSIGAEAIQQRASPAPSHADLNRSLSDCLEETLAVYAPGTLHP